MVSVSKHMFEEACKDVHCSVLLHPWHESCWKSLGPSIESSFIGSAKFYSIVHLAQNLMRGRRILEKTELIKAAEYYARSTILGGLVSATGVTLGCLLRWLMGRQFTYYTYLFIPNVLNGICILLEPPMRRGLIINLFCNLVIEFWMRLLERDGYISMTISKQTLMFMIGSAFLFYLMRLEGDRKQRTPVLWLFTPEKVRRKTDESKKVCPHDGSCVKHIAKGTAAYFGVGFALSVVRILASNLKTPLRALSTIRPKHLKMAMFFGSYIGIYRTVICLLCRKRGVDSELYALPAGYLAGLSFLFKPSLGFAIAAMTGAFKLYSTILYEKKILPEKVPLPLLIYCFCQGTLFHARFMHPDVCPGYVFNLMNSVTDRRIEELYTNFTAVLKMAEQIR